MPAHVDNLLRYQLKQISALQVENADLREQNTKYAGVIAQIQKHVRETYDGSKPLAERGDLSWFWSFLTAVGFPIGSDDQPNPEGDYA